ncbi:MAG: hypothetical protein IT266_04935 [Saprospiraceae bacterium]|nr:hypothetical protein [Saprospiraceae bacterium]
MKTAFVIWMACLAMGAGAQQYQQLFQTLPDCPTTCDSAFASAELEWAEEMLDNGTTFRRVTSWGPGGELKAYIERLERVQAFIERTSENNSFSLNAPGPISDDNERLLATLAASRKSIQQKWQEVQDQIAGIDENFVVPNEFEHGCDQIRTFMDVLSRYSEKTNAAYHLFIASTLQDLGDFQQTYDQLIRNRHPMISNRCLDEASGLMELLFQLNTARNIHYKNMVETRMTLNNAMCP